MRRYWRRGGEWRVGLTDGRGCGIVVGGNDGEGQGKGRSPLILDCSIRPNAMSSRPDRGGLGRGYRVFGSVIIANGVVVGGQGWWRRTVELECSWPER